MKNSKFMANNYVLVLIILLQLFSFTSCASKEIAEEQKQLEEMQISMERQEAAICANDDIMSVLVQNYGTGEDRYPDDFAGTYYRDSDARLVVMVTDMEGIKKYLDCTKYADAIVFEQAEYSYNLLNDSMEAIAQAYAKKYTVNFYGINQERNSIAISIAPEDYEAAMAENPQEMGIHVPIYIFTEPYHP